MATSYYNEIDPFAAAWLRELIAAGQIAPGVVDERSIEDVVPDELAGFTQCHFFAGIGVHSLALRRAGWPDDLPIWTGSCPCQPFSAAGKGEGFADERHLWPAFFHLIEQCEPAIVAGEQVASGSTGVWFDLVQADLEAMGYAFGLVPLPAAGFGGAHIRDRAFWLGHSDGARLEGHAGHGGAAGRQGSRGPVAAASVSGRVAYLHSDGCDQGRECIAATGYDGIVGNSANGGLADTAGTGPFPGAHPGVYRGEDGPRPWHVEPQRPGGTGGVGHNSRPGAPMLGRDAADWLFCRDGKWRPVGPGTFPLAHEAPARVGRLRGYGNAIDAETLTQFYAAVIAHLATPAPPLVAISEPVGGGDFVHGASNAA
ncbi:DNA cytosine methyltransferase [Sphingomonas sp. HH69]